jgi:hypothetical protein
VSAPLSKTWDGLARRWLRFPSEPGVTRSARSVVPAIVAGSDHSDAARRNAVGGRYVEPGFATLELTATDTPLWLHEVSVRRLSGLIGSPEVWLRIGTGLLGGAPVVTLAPSSFAARGQRVNVAAQFGRIPGFPPPPGTLIGAEYPLGAELRRIFPRPILLGAGRTVSLINAVAQADWTIVWEAAA